MKEKLENFIRENRKEFDELEPPAFIWEKIEEKLDNPGPKSRPGKYKMIRLSTLLKIAASVVIVLCAGLWFYQYQRKEAVDLANIDPQLARQQLHYTSLIQVKRSELKSIEKEEPLLYSEFSAEIRKLDENYQKLKNDLPASPNQEETVKAMIRNLQIQAQLLNQQLEIIEQVNKVKKEHEDEAQSI